MARGSDLGGSGFHGQGGPRPGGRGIELAGEVQRAARLGTVAEQLGSMGLEREREADRFSGAGDGGEAAERVDRIRC